MTVQAPREVRTIETAAATMRTYASPTTEPPTDVAVWRTELQAGTAGPLHTVDRDHVVVVVNGTLEVLLEEDRFDVPAGAAVTLSAGATRQLAAAPDGPVVTVTAARPGSSATVGDAAPVDVPWGR
jgi:quercetin dioxygenase-like cupin family protein